MAGRVKTKVGRSSVEALELRRQFTQYGVRHLSNRSQRMIGRDALLGRQVTEEVTEQLIVAACAGIVIRACRASIPSGRVLQHSAHGSYCRFTATNQASVATSSR